MRKRRTREELVAIYGEQWSFLRRSAAAFDAGESAEAKRLASTLRLLLHDSRKSKSLVSQLSLTETLYFDTAEDASPSNRLPTFALTHVHATNGHAVYEAPLAKPLGRPVWLIPFAYWWNKQVVVVPGEFALTRCELVTIMANQDGGVHVDPGIDDRYHRLANDPSVNWSIDAPTGNISLTELERVSVRQVAHEVMVSLSQPRRLIPNNLPVAPPEFRAQIVKDASTGVMTQRNVRIRMFCPCKSGLSYSECHAKGGINEGKVTVPVVLDGRST